MTGVGAPAETTPWTRIASRCGPRRRCSPGIAGEAWFDPIEAGLRGRIRGFIEELIEQELGAALGRGRYERGGAAAGHRHGHRTRRLTGTFGAVEITVPRARLRSEDGAEREWRSAALPR
jgi:putative transposase